MNARITEIIYDGDCGFCTCVIRSLAPSEAVQIPFQRLSEDEFLERSLTRDSCESAVVIRFARLQVSGAKAINALAMKKYPALTAAVRIVERVPLACRIEEACYRLVARHRARISVLLGMRSCSVK